MSCSATGKKNSLRHTLHQTCKAGKLHALNECTMYRLTYMLSSISMDLSLKVLNCEIFDRSDCHDFYTIKSLRVGDFRVKILIKYFYFSGELGII
jgi:hypothetical protein